MLTIQSTSEETREETGLLSWAMIYDAVTEIEALCVRHGKAGIVREIGRHQTALDCLDPLHSTIC